MYGSCPTESVSPHQYVETLKATLESAYARVRKHMKVAARRSEELYNTRVHGREFEVGDLVWLNNPVVPRGRSRKLHCPWTGPFKVIKKLSSVVYRIQDNRPGSRKRVVVHFDRLKPCPNDIRVKPVVRDKLKRPDSRNDHEQPAQPPGKDLQFFEDDDHDVTRETEKPSTSQEPGMPDRAVHSSISTDGEPSDVTPELTTGINSDGTVLEPTPATSPSSRPGDSGSVRHQKRIRQSPPEESTSRYPKRTRHAPFRYGW